MKRFLFFFVLLFSGVSIIAQNITVTGNVTSTADGEPLIGVNIIIKGTSKGTISDVDGNYELNNVPSNGTLEFSYVGYTQSNIAVNGQTIINASLSAGNLLNEVVVTSFGIAREKKTLGY